jgi:hypothetical protein
MQLEWKGIYALTRCPYHLTVSAHFPWIWNIWVSGIEDRIHLIAVKGNENQIEPKFIRNFKKSGSTWNSDMWIFSELNMPGVCHFRGEEVTPNVVPFSGGAFLPSLLEARTIYSSLEESEAEMFPSGHQTMCLQVGKPPLQLSIPPQDKEIHTWCSPIPALLIVLSLDSENG